MRTWMIIGAAAILVGILLSSVAAFPTVGAPQLQTPTPAPEQTPTPVPEQPAPQFQPPPSLPQGPLMEQELRTQLLELRAGLCKDLQLIAGVILNTGILRDVPPRIQELTGLTIDELSVDDPAITRSANLVESEHKPIDEGIARYNRTLRAVEQGQAQTNELVAIGRDIRSRTELHFGKEEESVIRPLQGRLTGEQFWPVVATQESAIGPWLRQHGWQGIPATR